MSTRFQFPMLTASLKATAPSYRPEYVIAADAGDEERTRGIQTKLDHIADLRWQIVGRPIEATDGL